MKQGIVVNSRQSLTIFLLCCICYANSLGGSFHYDDFHSIVDNLSIRSLANVPAFFVDMNTFSADPEKAMYRPVLLVTFAINYALVEYEAWGYLLVNLLIHAGCSVLVGAIGKVLIGGPAGFISGLLFAVNPICTEPVNYVSSRSESLAAFFYFAAFYYFAVQYDKNRWGVSWFGLSACAFGLLTKSTVATLPAILLVYDVSKRGIVNLKSVFSRLHFPYWLLLGIYLGVAWLSGYLPKSLGAPVRSEPIQIWTQLKAVPYYVQLLFFPYKLNVEHQFFESASWQDPAVILGMIFVAGLVAFVWNWRSHTNMRFAALFSFVVLLPATVMPLNMLVNERRIYLAAAGLAWITAYALKHVPVPLVVTIVVVMALHTIERNEVWGSDLTLWEDAVKKAPGMRRARANYGRALQHIGRREAAMAAYRKTIEIDPRNGEAYNNIATLYHEQGNFDEAIHWYKEALQRYPNYDEIYLNLGDAHFQKGEHEASARMFVKALKIDGSRGSNWSNYGLVLQEAGRLDDAKRAYEKAISLSPGLSEPYNNLGNVLSAQGKHETALQQYQKALARSSEDLREVEVNLATTYLELHRGYEAATLLKQAIDKGRGSALHHYHLGRAFKMQKDTKSAKAAFVQAHRIDPYELRPLAALGELLADERNHQEAIHYFRRALSVDPTDGRALFGLGKSLEETGSRTEAIRVYRDFLRSWTRTDGRRQFVESRMQELDLSAR